MSNGFTPDAPFDDGSGFAMDDVDPDNIASGGGGKLPEGEYRLSVTEVILQNDRGSIQLECEVVAATDNNHVGRKHFEYLRWPTTTDKDGGATAKRIILAWCYATKTTNADEIKARQQAKQGFDSRWLETMTGRDVLAFVKASEYEGKPQSKIQGNVWAIDDPKRSKMPGWAGTAQQQTQQQQTQQPQQPAAATADPFAGLV